jgi:hypothetical protein
MNSIQYCSSTREATICPGDTYIFYGKELTQPGTYVDTIVYPDQCDSIISLTLNYHETGSTGLQDSITLATNETATLIANEGFISYKWNDEPPSQHNTLTIIGSEHGKGTFYYTLEVEDVNGCIHSDTVKVIITGTTGTYPGEDPGIAVYPNPVTGNEFTIEYSTSSEATLIIYNQIGKEISIKKLSPLNTKASVQLPETKGLYYLKITSPEMTGYLKVMKL